MRRVVVGGMVAALGLFTACRTAEQAGERAVPTTVLVSARATVTGLVHDRTDIRITAQASDGSILGIGWREGPRTFRWNGGRWDQLHSVIGYPDQAVGLAADPSRPGEFLSLWSGEPDDGGNQSRLYLCRHAPNAPVCRVSFPNPTADANGRNAKRPAFTVDAAGDGWLLFGAELLIRVPADGGNHQVMAIPREAFQSPDRHPMRELGPLVFTLDGAGTGWLWSTQDADRGGGVGELFRPLRVTGGAIGQAPVLAGLPAEGRVVMVRADALGRTVWALQGRGLWRIDAVAGTAVPVDSPPGAEFILDWNEWEDGAAVALVFSGKRRPDQMAGEVWVRREGVWMNAGWSGDTTARTLSRTDQAVQPRAWWRRDDGLLGAGFNVGLIAVDFTNSGAEVRKIDWRDGLLLANARTFYPLADGRVLAQGLGTSVFWPDAFGRSGVSTVAEAAVRAWDFAESPVRDAEGRFWLIRLRGRGAPAVLHWNGTQWEEWPLPAERSWWPQEALWVDAAGRVAVFSDTLKGPVWERVTGAPGVWRRSESGFALVAARAAESKPAESWALWEAGFQGRPVLASGGLALVGDGGSLWYLSKGEWRRFTSRELGTAPYRYGFEADGTPWFYTNHQLRRLASDGTWRKVDGGAELRREQEHPRASHHAEWPAWIEARFKRDQVSAAHPDQEGDWWIVQNGELWRARGGEFAQVFAEDEPSPFRSTGFWFHEVKADAWGNRLFLRGPQVLLRARPAPELTVIEVPTEEPADYVVRITTPDVAWFEWRVDGRAWTRGRNDRLVLSELAAGTHILDVRGVSRMLDSGPITRREFTLIYDAEGRASHLVAKLLAAHQVDRAGVVRRLAMHGAGAKPILDAALAAETGEPRRWWLRAALQAIADAEARHLTNP